MAESFRTTRGAVNEKAVERSADVPVRGAWQMRRRQNRSTRCGCCAPFYESPGEGEARVTLPPNPLEHPHPIRVRILEVVVFPTDSGLLPIGNKPNLR